MKIYSILIIYIIFYIQVSNASNTVEYAEVKTSDGLLYKGPLINGKANGQGELTGPNNTKYRGFFIENKLHGRAIFSSAKGSEFFTYWNNGKKISEMIFAYPLKNYSGDYNEYGQRHGTGSFIFPNKDSYSGEWKNNKTSGYGEYIFFDNPAISYKGHSLDNYKHGVGKLSLKNGDYYIGNWKNGKRHGQGTLFIKNENITVEGKFDSGSISSGDVILKFSDGSILNSKFLKGAFVSGICNKFGKSDSLCHLKLNKLNKANKKLKSDN